MKLSLTSIIILLIFSTSAIASNTQAMSSKTEPQECLQCGVWQISGSGADGLEGQIIVINDKQIIIPSCGIFDYSTNQLQKSSKNPILNMSLHQLKASFLCPSNEGDQWTLDMKMSGHVKNNSIAEINLRKEQSPKPSLWLYCWNMDREDPCESGSGIGSSTCNSVERSLIYKALSDQVAKAYSRLLDFKIKKSTSFNAARFYASTLEYCIESEKDSGANAWPMAYAYGCQSEILQQKYEEFKAWDTCMQNKGNKLSSCKFPTENYVRSQKK